MDRNAAKMKVGGIDVVALRKESVDRNISSLIPSPTKFPSLSARRAWIEILISSVISRQTPVALRKESVDRNYLPRF